MSLSDLKWLDAHIVINMAALMGKWYILGYYTNKAYQTYILQVLLQFELYDLFDKYIALGKFNKKDIMMYNYIAWRYNLPKKERITKYMLRYKWCDYKVLLFVGLWTSDMIEYIKSLGEDVVPEPLYQILHNPKYNFSSTKGWMEYEDDIRQISRTAFIITPHILEVRKKHRYPTPYSSECNIYAMMGGMNYDGSSLSINGKCEYMLDILNRL